MKHSPKILVIGTDGQVGWELWRCLQPLGQVIATARQASAGRCSLDLSNNQAIIDLVQEIKPQIIVNAAAYTAVDKAESEEALATQINGAAVGVLAEQAKQLQALLVHYSTDYVFNGQKTTPYLETDAVCPLGAYGRSKLAGEQALQAVNPAFHLILRTAWVYGTRGKNFLLTMQRLARERPELRVVADQFGSPTWSRLIAEGTGALIARYLCAQQHDNLDQFKTLSGIYHLTCAERASWHDFASAIIALGEQHPPVHPITTADYPTPAQRPAFSVLSNAKLAENFQIALPDWRAALQLCVMS